MKNVLVFILGFILGLIVVLVGNNIQDNSNFPSNMDNPSTSIIENQDDESMYETKIIQGNLTGFADARSIEIVTIDGPITCRVYDDDIILKLEELIDTSIKLEVKYNKNTQVTTVIKILE